MRKNRLWIAWEDDGSIRSKVLAKEFNAKLCTFTQFEGNNRLSLLRYPVAVAQTFFAIVRFKPITLFVQNPSILLSFIAAFSKTFFGYQLVIDLHTHYIHPEGIKGKIIKFLNNYSLKNGDVIIVTNEAYKNKIRVVTNRKIFVLPDKIPDFNYAFNPIDLKGNENILFICTFSEDEPWEEVIHSASLLGEDTFIYISGRNKICKRRIPPNVILTDFIPDREYQNLLRTADIIMVLTTQEDCLVCGGYEAVAAEKPLILSDQKVLKKYFSKGTVITSHTRVAIADAIRQAVKNKSSLKNDIKELKKYRSIEWQSMKQNLLNMLREQ